MSIASWHSSWNIFGSPGQFPWLLKFFLEKLWKILANFSDCWQPLWGRLKKSKRKMKGVLNISGTESFAGNFRPSTKKKLQGDVKTFYWKFLQETGGKILAKITGSRQVSVKTTEKSKTKMVLNTSGTENFSGFSGHRNFLRNFVLRMETLKKKSSRFQMYREIWKDEMESFASFEKIAGVNSLGMRS